jgi:gamma-glutamylcyclotransferase (GGCT)/AIG2-like uncharacterized protein YtfP
MGETKHLPIFVYGTLKRGQRNERVWPHAPLRVTSAITNGEIYDLGPYPGMLRGNDKVSGELWFIDLPHMKDTIAALDRLEGFNQNHPNHYERVVVDCTDTDKNTHQAYTYFYLEELPTNAKRVVPNISGICCWPCDLA